MTNVKPEYYQSAYNKLYHWLQNHHPNILEEYRQAVKSAKEQAEAILFMAKETEKQ